LDGPLHVSIATIEHYFYSLISFIRTHKIAKRRYNGLIVHINNLDILLSHALTTKLVMHFLQEMRDILQTSHVYFFFLGPTTLFQFVYSEPRIHSAFCHSPLLLEPLTKKDIVHALNERMRLLQSDDVKQYIKPFEDRVIYSLYALYEGDLRSIMSALNDILSQCEGPIHNTLTSQNAMWLLGKERWSRIEHTIRFTKKRKEFLLYLIHQGGLVHYDQIIHQFQTTPANASAYYIQPFREVGILTMNEYSNKKWITLTAEYSPLMLWAQSKSIEELFKKSQRQPIHV
ncbi:MAG TPA: hypothetical protein VJB65_02890, partial [Patescibacteria group bacterium]|nr:hypothetical protein [Patescibacteria group bacterium]